MTPSTRPGRPRTRRADGRTRYDDLLDAATELFARLGYERTTVRAIADELEIESGSLYSHISSKEQVLRDIVGRTANAFFDRAEAALAAAERRAPRRGCARSCRAHMARRARARGAVRVYYDEWRKLDTSASARSWRCAAATSRCSPASFATASRRESSTRSRSGGSCW